MTGGSPVTTAAASQKAAARKEALARRDAIPADERESRSTSVAQADLPFDVTPGLVISAYRPVGSELDILPLLTRLVAEGARTALPVVDGPRKPLRFRAWAPGEPLEPGVRAIPVPPESVPEVVPDVLLVPLLAFDRAGYRLGYGAGYYDLTLAALRAARRVTAVGVGFAAQEVRELPREAHDERLDWMMTEAGALRCRGEDGS